MSALRILLLLSLSLLSLDATAAGKRVHVYPIDLPYWEVRKGDTLSAIAAHLLPTQPQLQAPLMQTIFEMNPDAFINSRRDRLKAGVRLWLPGSGLQTHSVETTPADGRTEQFSWGSITRQNP